nr:spectrin alpha chain-like [Nothobranchius furzeri]
MLTTCIFIPSINKIMSYFFNPNLIQRAIVGSRPVLEHSSNLKVIISFFLLTNIYLFKYLIFITGIFVPPFPTAVSPVLQPCFCSLVKPTITNLGVVLDPEMRMDSHISQDLIGVQNLLKKHQALQAEITGHEPRIKAVTQKGETMVEEGHFAGEEVKTKLWELHGRWDTLKAKASQRRQDLEDSLQAQQYFADANEAESWMREKEPIVGSPD